MDGTSAIQQVAFLQSHCPPETGMVRYALPLASKWRAAAFSNRFCRVCTASHAVHISLSGGIVKIRAIAITALLSAVILVLVSHFGFIKHGFAQNATATATTVSAASYAPIVAPEAIVAAFGTGLAATTRLAEDADSSQPGVQLPTLLGGASLEVNGRSAGMFFVSPGQINFQVPPGLEPGTGYVIIRNDRGVIVAAGDIEIRPAAPAIFAANGFGNGAPAGLVIRVKPDGQQIYDSLSVFDPRSGTIVPRPIDLGADGDRIFLAIFITGARRITTPNDTRVLIGGQELRPIFVGASPEFVGLEQVNFELPRTLRGRLTFVFTAIGFPTSNPCELEIAPPKTDPPRVVALNKTTVLASESIEITGGGFSEIPAENAVTVVDRERKEFNAQIEEASATRLKVKVPFGSGSGSIAVQTARGRVEYPFTMRTSVSGIVQTAQLQPSGEYKRIGVKGVTVRTSAVSTTTNDDGSFLLADVPSASKAFVEIDGRSSTLNFDKEIISMRVNDARDNQYSGYIELKAISGQSIRAEEGVLPHLAIVAESEVEPAQNACAGLTRQVLFEPNGSTAQFPDGTRVNSISATVLDPGRTPVDLPPAHFSSTVVQLTPFGARLNPGGKLTFPNCDGLPAGSTATLFRFDQTPGSATLGQVVPAGSATVTADGQRIETARDAIKETTYYFVSVPRPTTTIYGSVVEEDQTPARGALVQVRGQSIFALTDQNGAFILPNVPIVGTNNLTLEVSYLRADSTVDRTERGTVKPTLGGLIFVSPAIVLPGKGRTRAPVILAPKTLSIEAGKNSEFGFIAYARIAGQSLRGVTVAGATFASVIANGNDRYTLRLTPAANIAGQFTLTLRAEDSQGLVSTETIALEVKAAAATPVANSQSVITDEDTSVNITLTGSNGNAFRIVTPPRFGSLSGTAPNLTYTPAKDFNGADSFSFTVSNSATESSPATAAIAVRAINDAPRLEVGATYATNIGQQLNFVINGTDVDMGQKLTLTSTGLPLGATITQTTATSWLFGWTPKFDQLGSYTVSLTLGDDGVPVLSDGRAVTIVVDAKWSGTSQMGASITYSVAVLGNILFAGTYGGGVYRTTDNGVSWTGVNNGLDNQFVLALTIRENALFAGTNQGGVYRTTDNGASWTQVNNGLGNQFVRALTVKENALFAGTFDSGVYRTTDNGASWTQVNNGLGNQSVFTLAVKENALFAATDVGVYRTTDNGANWMQVNNGLGNQNVRALAVKENALFAGTNQSGVYRTTDNGASWTAVNNGLGNQNVRVLTVKENALFAGTFDSGVYRTADNGASWTQVNNGLGNQSVFTLAVKENALFAGTFDSGVYRTTDNGAIWTETNNGLGNQFVLALRVKENMVFAGTNEGGVYRTTDNGSSWTAVNNGLGNRVVFALTVKENALFAGTFGGGIYRTTDNGSSWTAVNNGLGSRAVYALAVKENALFAGTNGSGIYRTTDSGASWTAVNNGLGNLVVYVLSVKGNMLFAGTSGGGIYRTTDNGANWTEANNGLGNQFVLALTVRENALFAGTKGGGVYRSIDDGMNWTEVNNGLSNRVVYALTVKENALFAGTFGNGIYRTTDNGASWTAVNNGLVSQFVYALTVKENALFAGTLVGVYQLAEAATNWTESDTGLTNRNINASTLSGESFLVGTFGGGVFRSTDKAQSWLPANTGLPPAADVRTFTSSGNGVLAGLAGEGVYFSNDQGQSWAARNAGLTSRSVNALAGDGGAVYAGTNSGVFRSADGGANWTAVNAGLTRSQVLSLAISGGSVYAGTDNGLFRSTNQGASWTEVSTGLTDRYIVSLGVAPNGTALLAGTSSGLFRSTNQGQSWTPVTSGVPERVVALTFVQKGTKLLMGSVNGFFVSEDNGASWQQINGGLLTLQVGALAVSGDTVLAGTRSGGVFVSQLP